MYGLLLAIDFAVVCFAADYWWTHHTSSRNAPTHRSAGTVRAPRGGEATTGAHRNHPVFDIEVTR